MKANPDEKKAAAILRKRVQALLKNFKTSGFLDGDLVITAEIHRVIDARWGQKNYSKGMAVVTVFPPCQTCGPNRVCQHEHIMESSAKSGGQQRVMALKD